MISKQSLGGQVTAKISRAAALERYYHNPSICKHCGEIILVCEGQKVKVAKSKIFCSSSCAATFNNLLRPRKQVSTRSNPLRKKKVTTGSLTTEEKRAIQNARTKKELFSSRATWQSARSQIQKMARSIYSKSDKTKSCQVCGYDKHYEVCHVKSVSSFSDTCTIGEINDLSNLVALCPTHHWEFDKGLLSF